MGLFDRFKKQKHIQKENEPTVNYPEMLTAKILFYEKPNLDPDKILEKLKSHFANVENPENGKALLYFFPDIQVKLADSSMAAQCCVFIPDENKSNIEISTEAFQQNWGWKEGNHVAATCKYEVLLSDLMTRTLDYKDRFNLFSYFLTAVTEATDPQIVYPQMSQKLVNPAELLDSMKSNDKRYLESFVNVRLYNISNGDEGELFMDTIGLHVLGLPDIQIRFTKFDPGQIAGLLLNYSYYIFEQGDVIENGHTLPGLEPGSKWKCEKQMSQVAPQRVVINIAQ